VVTPFREVSTSSTSTKPINQLFQRYAQYLEHKESRSRDRLIPIIAAKFANSVSKLKDDLLARFRGADQPFQLHSNFTHEYCETTQEFYPHKNVLVVHTDHEVKFGGFIEGSPSHEDLTVGLGPKIGYDCYGFDKGGLMKRGDGCKLVFHGEFQQVHR
jgi:hypothetical protein